jgi:transcription elongation factor Elf1
MHRQLSQTVSARGFRATDDLGIFMKFLLDQMNESVDRLNMIHRRYGESIQRLEDDVDVYNDIQKEVAESERRGRLSVSMLEERTDILLDMLDRYTKWSDFYATLKSEIEMMMRHGGRLIPQVDEILRE